MDLRVSTPAVSAGAQRFTTVADELLNQITIVGREISSLRGEWSGPAAVQFDSLMAQWNNDANNMTHVLNEIVMRLNTAAHSYEDVENAIKNSFNG